MYGFGGGMTAQESDRQTEQAFVHYFSPLIQVSATIIELGRANPNGRVHATYPGSPFYAPSSGIDHETEAAAIKRRDRFRLNAVAVAAVDVDQHKGNGRVIRIKGERGREGWNGGKALSRKSRRLRPFVRWYPKLGK